MGGDVSQPFESRLPADYHKTPTPFGLPPPPIYAVEWTWEEGEQKGGETDSGKSVQNGQK